jgi:hypothetical protein
MQAIISGWVPSIVWVCTVGVFALVVLTSPPELRVQTAFVFIIMALAWVSWSKAIAKYALFSGLVLSLFQPIAELFKDFHFYTKDLWRLSGAFATPNEIYPLLMFTYCGVVSFAVHSNRNFLPAGWASLILIGMTGLRGVALAAFAATAVASLKKPRRTVQPLLFASLILLMAIVLLRGAAGGSIDSSLSRVDAYSVASEAIIPLPFGAERLYAYGNFIQFQAPNQDLPLSTKSLFAQMIYELGWLGVILSSSTCVILCLYFYALIRGLNVELSAMWCWLFLVACLVAGLFDAVILVGPERLTSSCLFFGSLAAAGKAVSSCLPSAK